MKKRIVLFTLVIFSLNGFTSDLSFDSLFTAMRAAPESIQAVDEYNNQIAKIFANDFQNKKEDFRKYISNTIKIAERLKYIEGLALAHYHLGKFYIGSNSNYSNAIPELLEGITLYEKIPDSLGVAKCYMQLGLISYITQYFEDAIKNFEISLKYYDYPTSIYLTALCYTELDNFNQAKKYFKRAIQSYAELKNEKGLNECFMYMGRMYMSEKIYDSAYYYLDLAIHQQSIIDPLQMSRPYALISEYYFNTNQLDSALKYAQTSYKMTVERRDQISAILATEILSKVYDARKDYEKAHKFLKTHDEIQYANMQGSTKQKIAEMHIMFDFKRKMDQEQQKHQEEIREKNRTKNFLLISGIFVIMISGGLWSRLQYVRKSKELLQNEKNKSERLLLNILPEEIAQELKETGIAKARKYEQATILFSDFKCFTEYSANLSPSDLVNEINHCFEAFDRIMDKYKIEKIKTIGDSYMAAGGIPVPSEDSVKNTVLAGLEMQKFISDRKEEMDAKGYPAFEMRVGIHTGPVVAGIVGVKKFQYDIWGDTVNTASRMESVGTVNRVNISKATYELLRDDVDFTFESRGKIEAKGKGKIEMFFVSLAN